MKKEKNKRRKSFYFRTDFWGWIRRNSGGSFELDNKIRKKEKEKEGKRRKSRKGRRRNTTEKKKERGRGKEEKEKNREPP